MEVAAIDVPNNPSDGLRREVTAEELARARLEYEERREQDARLQMTALTVGAVFICLGAGWLFARRTRLAAAADDAIVDVVARGLITGRKINSSAKIFADRVRERADGCEPEAK